MRFGYVFNRLTAMTMTTAAVISVSALTFINAISATAAPTVLTEPATINTSAPVFYGDDSKYPFSSAVRVGNTLYLSGQIGIKDGKLVKGGIKPETKQTLDNINATLRQYGYQQSDLIKCSVMLADMDDFSDFNDVYQSKLSRPYPVRSAFGVEALALGAAVEIECMAAK